MKKTLWAGLAMGLVMLSGVANANLIVNGSFETLLLTDGGWQVYENIAGWYRVSGSGIEVQHNAAGAAYDGSQLVELDSHYNYHNTGNNSAMEQAVQTTSGQSYILSFAYSPRPGVASDSNKIDVFWNGESLTSNNGITAAGQQTTIWTLMNFNVIGTGGLDKIVFGAKGTADSLGGYLDAVSLNPVPEPATMLLFGTGIVGLAGLARKRIMN